MPDSEAKLALQLDPVSSRSHMNLSFVYERAITLHPDTAEAVFPLSVIYVEKHEYAKAIHEFQRMGNLPHGVGRYEIALVYAGLQENDKAFEWLENACQSRDKGLTYLKIDPCLDPLRSDARLASLIQRVGIPAS